MDVGEASSRSMLSTYRKLFHLLDARERRLAALVFGLMVFVALVEMVGVASIMPFIAVLSNPGVIETNPYLAFVYRRFEFQSQESFLFWLGAAVFLLLVSSLALRAFAFWVQVRFSNMRNHALGFRLVAGYLNQPYEWFLNRHSSEFATNVLQEVSQVVNGSLFPAMQVIAHGLVVATLLILLVAVDPILALSVAVVLASAYGIIFFTVRNFLTRIGSERRRANQQRFNVVNEAFGGIKDLKISGLEMHYAERFRKPSVKMARRQTTAKIIGALPSFAMQALVFGGMILVVLYLMATKGGFQEALPLLALYAFAGYRLMPALQALYAEFSQLRFSDAALNSLYRDLQILDQRLPPPASRALPLQVQLELIDIRYTYPGAGHAALDGVSLVVPAHATVALVGSTGSGKTTTVDVILGLLQPQSGYVQVDGHAITGENVRAWQRSLGYVPQQIYLTDDTVAANIAFGVPRNQVDHAAVERAARIANLHDFVVSELAQGYDTPIGERGIRLSGGQRQRIGIARALYHDPDMLILDEATSALDNLTERAVMEAVHNIGNRKTIIMIAHRLSTVRNCDCIYLLEHGRIVGQGTYDELIDQNADFRAMAGYSELSN
jgi:ATP-binding cassette, subfamily B, bacterial PglK